MSTTVSVHRCRFVDYSPTSITALAFPPLPLPPVKGKGKGTEILTRHFGTLAVGRANGNIELHEWTGAEDQTQAPQAWALQKILPGPVPSKVDSLVFTLRRIHSSAFHKPLPSKNLRLFSTGGGSEILEWDLEKGTILRSVASQAGSVWSMAANPSSTLLALGCEDGVRILSLADDTLTHHRRFDRVKSRLLSIAWGPPVPRRSSRTAVRATGTDSSSDDDDETDELVDSFVVAGCSDSSLRKFDVASGRVLDRMSTDKARGERTLVWAIGVLGDGTVVSGDSLGTVKFWDSTTCTQIQSFQAHGADVLCLAIGPEGESVYTSGVDQKVCQFSHVKLSGTTEDEVSGQSRSRWIQSSSRRLHSHDVRAVAVWPPYVPIAAAHRFPGPSPGVAPLLISGGLDMSLVICPCSLPSSHTTNIVNPIATSPVSTFDDAYHLRVPYSTGLSPAVQVAREAKLVLCRRDSSLGLWRIMKNASPGEVGLVDLEDLGKKRSEDWEKVVVMDLKVRTNLVASAISSDGRWMAASDLHETKLFHLLHGNNGIRPKRVKLSAEHGLASTGATSLLFTADSSKMVLGASMGSSLVIVVDLAGEGSDSPRILRSFEHHRMQNVVVGSGSGRAIKSLPISVDANGDALDPSEDELPVNDEGLNKRPVTASSLATTIVCMAASMDGQWLASADTRHRIHVFNLDSVQHHCVLPSFPHAIAALTFDPFSPSMLVIGLADNTLQVFDVEARQFPEWSRALCQGLPNRISHLHDPLLGIVFDPDPAAEKAEKDGGRRVLLWGSSWMCKVKLSGPATLGGSSSKKRRRESKRLSAAAAVNGDENGHALDEDQDFKLVTRYRPMLLVDFIGPSELVVMERPLVDLLSTLPPAYFKPTYGS